MLHPAPIVDGLDLKREVGRQSQAQHAIEAPGLACQTGEYDPVANILVDGRANAQGQN
jgi:hypothetical protein